MRQPAKPVPTWQAARKTDYGYGTSDLHALNLRGIMLPSKRKDGSSGDPERPTILYKEVCQPPQLCCGYTNKFAT
jgi:hypothetical protein